MKPNEYLAAVLSGQELEYGSDPVTAMQTERDNVEQLLREGFPDSPIKIRYAGSWAKTTMIKESYDLDITCYFNRDDDDAGGTLEDIYNAVKKVLEQKYAVEPKRSALRLSGKEGRAKGVYYHVDVVPGRFVSEDKDEAYLYQATGEKKRLKTNLQVHIDHVKNSGLVDVIKLLKCWKQRRNLTVLKTFVLELLVIDVLERKDGGDLAGALVKFWTALRDNADGLNPKDPANPGGNDLSPLFDAGVRAPVSAAARAALVAMDRGEWESIFGPIAHEQDAASRRALFEAARASITVRPKPWSSS